jgi:F0F1-type ATP synthase delta subunit
MRLNPKLKGDLKKHLLEKLKNDKEKVIVYSSVALSDGEKKILKLKLPSITFQKAEYRVDEELIAGVVVTVGSKVIDLSIKGTLSNLKHIVYEDN